MWKCISEIINLKEAMFQFSNDKKRIEARITQLEKERKILTDEEHNNNTTELNNTIKMEIKNLHCLKLEYDQKISKIAI